MTKKSEFSQQDVDILIDDTVYNGFFTVKKICLRHKLFAGGWSSPIEREVFMRGAAVAAVLYDPINDLIGLIQQFRVGALAARSNEHSPWLFEVVAGMHTPGKTAEEVITQELEEEAGIRPQRLEHICEYYSSPGGTDETVNLFCALAPLENAGGIYGLEDENEDIKMVVYRADEMFQRLYDDIGNAATLISLQWLQTNRRRLQRKCIQHQNGVAT